MKSEIHLDEAVENTERKFGSWSDNATVVAFDVFGFRFFHAPKHVTGLKKQEVER